MECEIFGSRPIGCNCDLQIIQKKAVTSCCKILYLLLKTNNFIFLKPLLFAFLFFFKLVLGSLQIPCVNAKIWPTGIVWLRHVHGSKFNYHMCHFCVSHGDDSFLTLHLQNCVHVNIAFRSSVSKLVMMEHELFFLVIWSRFCGL